MSKTNRTFRQGGEVGDLEKVFCPLTKTVMSECPCLVCFELRALKARQDADRRFADNYKVEAKVRDRNRGFGRGHFDVLDKPR